MKTDVFMFLELKKITDVQFWIGFVVYDVLLDILAE
jgi:hypothetical protein